MKYVENGNYYNYGRNLTLNITKDRSLNDMFRMFRITIKLIIIQILKSYVKK